MDVLNAAAAHQLLTEWRTHFANQVRPGLGVVTPDTFPELADGTAAGGVHAAERLLARVGWGPGEIDIVAGDEPPQARGPVLNSGWVEFEVALLNDPPQLLARLAREVAWLSNEPSSPWAANDGRAAELAAVAQGMGVLVANGSEPADAGDWPWRREWHGHLSAAECAFALALFARESDEWNPGWAGQLRPDIRAAFAAWLAMLPLSHDAPLSHFVVPIARQDWPDEEPGRFAGDEDDSPTLNVDRSTADWEASIPINHDSGIKTRIAGRPWLDYVDILFYVIAFVAFAPLVAIIIVLVVYVGFGDPKDTHATLTKRKL